MTILKRLMRTHQVFWLPVILSCNLARGCLACELIADCLDVGQHRIAGEFEAGDGTLGGFAMTEAAGVFDDDRDVAEVGAMARRRFNPNFHRNAYDGEGANAAVAQSDVERSSLKGRHRDFVEDTFTGQRREFWNDLESWRVAQEPRLNLFGGCDSLPCHRSAKLKCAH